MNKRKNQMDQLSKSILSFQKLTKKYQQETQYMRKLYESIKGQCLVFIYMAPKIRKLISEEELSGFIIYLEERFKPIVLSFNHNKSSFENFLLKVASFRALNYLSKKIREERLDFALSKFSYLEEQARVSEKESYLFLNEQQCPEKEREINILRYICTKRPSFQKRIFIYMLSIVPYLDAEFVEKICESFNIDLEETLAIVDVVVRKSTQIPINSREKYLTIRNRNWSRLLYTQLELEQVCENNKFEALQKREQLYLCKNENVNLKLDTLKKKVNYSLLSEVLNIPIGTISSTIYLVKNVLKAIGTDKFEKIADEGSLVSLIQNATIVEELPIFSPFKEFCFDENMVEQEE